MIRLEAEERSPNSLEGSSEVAISPHDLLLLDQLNVNVVWRKKSEKAQSTKRRRSGKGFELTEISCGLKLGKSKTAKRFPGFGVAVLLHEPPRRLRTKVDSWRNKEEVSSSALGVERRQKEPTCRVLEAMLE